MLFYKKIFLHTIKLLLLLIFIISAQSVSYSSQFSYFDSFYNLRVMYDAAADYKLKGYETDTYEGQTNEWEVTVHDAEDSGKGLALQYSIGLGIFVPDHRPWFGIGFLTETQMIYSSDSSIFSIGVGFEIKILKYFNIFGGPAWSLFSKKLPDVKKYEYEQEPVLKNESWNGESTFLGGGVNIPVYRAFDLFMQVIYYEFDLENHEGQWSRLSLRLGVGYIH